MQKQQLRVPVRHIYQILILFILGVIAALITLWTDSAVVHIICLWALGLAAIVISKLDIMHPYCWFTVIFLLYSSANAILYTLGFRNGNYSREQILYPIIALTTALVFIGPGRNRNTDRYVLKTSNALRYQYKYLDLVLLFLIVLTFFFSFMLLRSGYSGKVAMKRASDTYYRIGVYTARFITFFTIVRTCSLFRQGKRYMRYYLWGGAACLAFTFCTGERDAFIRFFLITILLLFSFGKIQKRHFLILIPVSIITLIVSVEIKYYFLRGSLEGNIGNESWIDQFLSSDFSAMGNNLQYLLDRPWTKSYFGFKLLFTELLYPFLPPKAKVNPDRWFNYDVHVGGSHGHAFTLVGTGYIISGILGVIIVFILVSLLIRRLYYISANSTLHFAAYLYSITIIMVSFRQSINTIVNCMLKEVLVAVLFLLIMNGLTKKVNLE